LSMLEAPGAKLNRVKAEAETAVVTAESERDELRSRLDRLVSENVTMRAKRDCLRKAVSDIVKTTRVKDARAIARVALLFAE
jgi:regulator of replication initiation timing